MPATAVSNRRLGVHLGGAILLATLMRIRFLWAPLISDEGGFLSVARFWAGGGALYRDLFVDRPQGLLVLFRVWDALPGTGPVSTRWLAILAGAAVVVGAAGLAGVLAGRRAAVIAGWLAAMVTAAPLIEGFASNGELLAAAFALPGLALIAWVLLRRPQARLAVPAAFGAGVLSAAGLTVKQSAFDGIVAVGVWVVVALALRWRTVRQLAAPVLGFGIGVVVVLGAMLLHGRSLGWADYRYALVGYRTSTKSGLTNPEFGRLLVNGLFVLPVFAPILIVVVPRCRAFVKATPRRMLYFAWLATSFAAFAMGGSFHRHYFIILATPVAVGAAAVLSTRTSAGRTTRLVGLLAIAAAIPCIVAPRLVLGNSPYTNRSLAAWVDSKPAGIRPTIYAYCASAALYSLVDQQPPVKYLWQGNVQDATGAQQNVHDVLTGPNAPDAVAVFVYRNQPCDRTGQLTADLAARYHRIGRIGGVDVLWRNDLPAVTLP